MDGFRETTIKSRPSNPRHPRSIYRRCNVVENTQHGKQVFSISRKNGEATKHLLFDGGAYPCQIVGMQWKMIVRLIDQAVVDVTVPLYPLTPEHTCKEILRFVSGVYQTLLCDAKQIVVLGDSSGGGMTLALAQLLRDAGTTQPNRLVLMSPWLDVTCSGPEQEILNRTDPLLALPGLRECGRWYVGTLSATDPRVSPLFGDLSGLSPILLLTGTQDLLNFDAHRLQLKMTSQGNLKMAEYRNMLHVWPSMPIPEAKEALAEILAFLSTSSAPAQT
jgi:monoterpene epsilon-lactone hydrolase